MKWFIIGFTIAFSALIGTDLALDSRMKNKRSDIC